MRRLAMTTALVLALAAVPAHAMALEPPVDTMTSEITSMRSGLDGRTVRFEAEVISEALAGGDGHVWLNVLSDGAAVGVWMPEAMAAAVTDFGEYAHSGDIVRVTGTLNEGCDLHGGDLDVHASALEVISPGEPRHDPVEWWKLGAGFGGLVIAYLGWRRMRRIEEAREP